MQSASTVQTIAPQTTIEAVGKRIPSPRKSFFLQQTSANRSDIAVAGSLIDRPDQTALSDSEGNAKAEAKRSSIAITTPPGPVSHRTRPHLRVKLCFPACEMFSNVFSPSTYNTSEELLSRIQVFEGLAWCWYSAQGDSSHPSTKTSRINMVIRHPFAFCAMAFSLRTPLMSSCKKSGAGRVQTPVRTSRVQWT